MWPSPNAAGEACMVWALPVHGKGAEIYRWYMTVVRVLADPFQPTALAGALKVGAHQGALHSPYGLFGSHFCFQRRQRSRAS